MISSPPDFTAPTFTAAPIAPTSGIAPHELVGMAKFPQLLNGLQQGQRVDEGQSTKGFAQSSTSASALLTAAQGLAQEAGINPRSYDFAAIESGKRVPDPGAVLPPVLPERASADAGTQPSDSSPLQKASLAAVVQVRPSQILQSAETGFRKSASPDLDGVPTARPEFEGSASPLPDVGQAIPLGSVRGDPPQAMLDQIETQKTPSGTPIPADPARTSKASPTPQSPADPRSAQPRSGPETPPVLTRVDLARVSAADATVESTPRVKATKSPSQLEPKTDVSRPDVAAAPKTAASPEALTTITTSPVAAQSSNDPADAVAPTLPLSVGTKTSADGSPNLSAQANLPLERARSETAARTPSQTTPAQPTPVRPNEISQSEPVSAALAKQAASPEVSNTTPASRSPTPATLQNAAPNMPRTFANDAVRATRLEAGKLRPTLADDLLAKLPAKESVTTPLPIDLAVRSSGLVNSAGQPTLGDAQTSSDPRPTPAFPASSAPQPAANNSANAASPVTPPPAITEIGASQPSAPVTSVAAITAPQAATPNPALDASGSIRVAAPQLENAIDQLTETRSAAQASKPELTLRHQDFGAITMRLETVGNDLRATLTARDPGFVPAIQTALAERAVSASSETAAGQSNKGQDQGGSQSNANSSPGSMGQGWGSDGRYGSSTGSGQGTSQPYLGQTENRDEEARSKPRLDEMNGGDGRTGDGELFA